MYDNFIFYSIKRKWDSAGVNAGVLGDLVFFKNFYNIWNLKPIFSINFYFSEICAFVFAYVYNFELIWFLYCTGINNIT